MDITFEELHSIPIDIELALRIWAILDEGLAGRSSPEMYEVASDTEDVVSDATASPLLTPNPSPVVSVDEDDADDDEMLELAAAVAASMEDDNDENSYDISEDEDDTDVIRPCCVCLTNSRCMLLLPCTHLAACMTCLKRLARDAFSRNTLPPCPICRGTVLHYVKCKQP